MIFGLFRRRKDPANDATSVGSLLVALGYIDGEQLEHALSTQSLTGEQLCDTLVGLHVITEWQARDALNEQKIRRGELAPRAQLKVHRERNRRLAAHLAAGHK